MKEDEKKYRLLIVDDDDDLLNDLVILLSPLFDIDSANGTEEALACVESDPPDCMLLDMNMPAFFGDESAMEGLSFLSEVRKRFVLDRSRFPVIGISSSEKPELTEEIDYPDAFLRKPLEIEALSKKVRELIEECRNQTD